MVVTAVAVVNRDDGVIIAIVEVLRNRRLAPGSLRVNRMRTFRTGPPHCQKLTGTTGPEPLECRFRRPREGQSHASAGSISQRLSGFDGAARVLKKHKVLVVELHHRENERRADTEQ